MVLMLLAFTYNLIKTNLTFIGMGNTINDLRSTNGLADARDRIVGSISSFNGLVNITYFENTYCWNTVGDIGIAFANMYKLNQIWIMYAYHTGNNVYISTSSDKIYGDITVFGDKYNMTYLRIYRYINVNGQLKDLKNLKKIYAVQLSDCSCTGSQTDLYNNGANIRLFNI